MGKFAELLFSFVRKSPRDDTGKKSEYVFYKIVDVFDEWEYILQCINTKATFQSSIKDVVLDADILHGLHPIQSCYVGIEYAKFLKQPCDAVEIQKHPNKNIAEHPISRYGRYSVCYQNRTGEICFINKKTQKETLMDPRDIALSEELIQEFDAIQAFYIGLLSGLKLHNPIENNREKARPHLRLVKS